MKKIKNNCPVCRVERCFDEFNKHLTSAHALEGAIEQIPTDYSEMCNDHLSRFDSLRTVGKATTVRVVCYNIDPKSAEEFIRWLEDHPGRSRRRARRRGHRLRSGC